MTQVLNRLISIIGASTATSFVFVEYPYSSYMFRVLGTGEWGTFIVPPEFFEIRRIDDENRSSDDIPNSASLAAALPGFCGLLLDKAYYLEGDRTSGVELPFPTNLAADVPFTLRIVGSDPDDYLEGEVVYVNPRTQQFGTVVAGWTLWLRQGVTVHGNTFPVGDDLRLSIVGRGQEEPIATPAKRVWARLSERGADLGLVIGDTATGEGRKSAFPP